MKWNHPLDLRLMPLTAALGLAVCAAQAARADAVTEWNITAGEVVTAAAMLTPPANRVMALAHTAAYEAANAITKRYPQPSGSDLKAAPGASVEAAIAAAHRSVLTQLLPAQKAAIEKAYQAALGKIGDEQAKAQGVAVGEAAAAALQARRADDQVPPRESYRPLTTAGTYTPTATPIVTQWPGRKPWLMTSASQFRPGPPPALSSESWARDYNEIKSVGGRGSTARTAEQTDIARFWEATLPTIYHGLVRSLAHMPGRDITQNARLFAVVTQATDDSLIAVFDAKYHYFFWRPMTAIRNGDRDGNDATERDASWLPLIDTPMHPEYPCAHCIQAAAIGVVLQAELGQGGKQPVWTTSSSTANGASRSWTNLDAFVQEVADARVYDGVHYRFSTETAMAMGKQIGALAAARWRQH